MSSKDELPLSKKHPIIGNHSTSKASAVQVKNLSFNKNNAIKVAIGDFEKQQYQPDIQPRIQTLLATTLDLEELLSLFLAELRALMPIDGLSFKTNDQQTNLTLGDGIGHKANFKLLTQGDHVGELSVIRKKKFNERELKLLESLSGLTIYPIRNALRYKEALQSALTDPLTQAGNRICLDNHLKKEIDVAHRYQRPLSVLMIDIDHFKQTNDQFGHAAGDTVLKSMVAAIAENSRCADATFRYGGEEFIVVLNNTDIEGAQIIAERLRSAIAGLACIHRNTIEIPVTVSIGCADLAADETASQLIQRADQALYQAKANGRNRVICDQTQATGLPVCG